jgi:hypothetical protein
MTRLLAAAILYGGVLVLGVIIVAVVLYVRGETRWQK